MLELLALIFLAALTNLLHVVFFYVDDFNYHKSSPLKERNDPTARVIALYKLM